MAIACWNCGQRLEDIHQLSDVHQVGICLFGRCPRCGKDVACRELIKIKKVIDLRGKQDGRTRAHRASTMHDLDISDHKTGIQGRQAEKQPGISRRSETMDRRKHLGIDSVDGPSNIRKSIPGLVGRDKAKAEKGKSGTK